VSKAGPLYDLRFAKAEYRAANPAGRASEERCFSLSPDRKIPRPIAFARSQSTIRLPETV
jgi:hypothetical protein